MSQKTRFRLLAGSAVAAVLVAGAIGTAYAAPWDHGGGRSTSASFTSYQSPFLATGTTTIRKVASTVPSTGDVNPYGIALVPRSTGHLVRGDLLVSNFNNKANTQGTGSTIVEVNPVTHRTALFARITEHSLPSSCPGGIGLTTALTVLQSGWVVVGSTPTTDGTPNTLHSGCLIVLNSVGRAVEVITGHGLNGPWDLAAVDWGFSAELFVSNVLNGVSSNGRVVDKGDVVRLKLDLTHGRFRIDSAVIVASGLPEQTSSANLIQGPTGLAVVGSSLFIADTLDNRIAVVHFATTRHFSGGRGFTVAQGGLIKWPLGLAALPNGVLLVANGGNGNLIAVTPFGVTALVKALDTTAMPGSEPGAGSLFGLIVVANGHLVFFVDDVTNTLGAVGPLGTTPMWNGPSTTPVPVPTSTWTPTPAPTSTWRPTPSTAATGFPTAVPTKY